MQECPKRNRSSKFLLEDVKACCREHSLRVSGKKDELVKQIFDFLQTGDVPEKKRRGGKKKRKGNLQLKLNYEREKQLLALFWGVFEANQEKPKEMVVQHCQAEDAAIHEFEAAFAHLANQGNTDFLFFWNTRDIVLRATVGVFEHWRATGDYLSVVEQLDVQICLLISYGNDKLARAGLVHLHNLLYWAKECPALLAVLSTNSRQVC